ncbi:MAG: hypothetical protein NTW95_02940 [Candidatus Aminicenantes bacterium]|nr:hypothetical protein [Candidatus Aminicenantes bacterium]
MKSRCTHVILCLLIFFSPCLALSAQEADDNSVFIIDDFLMERLPGGYFYPNFIENLAPDATFLLEESYGFAQLDPAKVYFEGDSFTQFNWFFAGFPINSALDDGAPAFQLPLLAIGSMALQGETPQHRDYGFHFNPRAPAASGSRLMVSTVFPDMGGYTALGKLAIGNHPSLRAEDLYSSRRKISANEALDYCLETKTPLSAFSLAFSYFNLDRRFNDFNIRDAQFEEDGRLLQFLSRWQRTYARGTLDCYLAANSSRRDRFLAEEGRYEQETYALDKKSWFAGLAWQGRPFNLKVSWQLEGEKRAPAVLDAGKDLRDIDGQGFWPFEKWGEFQATTLAVALERTVAFTALGKKAVLEPYLNGTAVFLAATERSGSSNAIYFAGQPYQVVQWQGGSAYRNQRLLGTGGALLSLAAAEKVTFNARLFFLYQQLRFQTGRNDCQFFQPGAEAGITWNLGKGTRLSLAYGVLPYELRANVNDFLEDQRPDAYIYTWQDNNHDGLFQEEEKGSLYGQSGGSSHFLSPDLRVPHRERLLLQLTTRLSNRFTLHIKGLYKKIRQPLWVCFADTYGHYEDVSGQGYYFFDRPFQAFRLSNSAFAKDPFYAQFLVQFQGQKPGRWFFSFSFLAHIGMGTTAFGNGPTANDIGIISESQAFPNSWINGYGRVDGDRAFVGKVFFGTHLSKRLFLSASIKYRDGDPFAFFNAFKRNGQWVITYQTIKAEDEAGRKGGPREDCIWDFNFKLSHEFALFGTKGRLELGLFNLLDFGLELSENVFADESRRLANELQLPRSLRLGVSFEW